MSLPHQAVRTNLTLSQAYGHQPNLIGITHAAHDSILDQIKAAAEVAANTSNQGAPAPKHSEMGTRQREGSPKEAMGKRGGGGGGCWGCARQDVEGDVRESARG